ncbi:MAG: mechanosensitive ion channel family protein [Myxococcota bacterium]
MEADTALRWGHRLLNATLFRLHGIDVTILSVMTALVITLLTLRFGRLAEIAVRRALNARGVRSEATLVPAAKFARYLVLFTGFAIAINTVGIDLGALFAAGAVFAVGLGFAMQSIAQNFVSGVILLVERAVKPGDVVEVNESFVRIVEVGIRSTIARTLDDEELIVPNHMLAQSAVRNYTYQSSICRLRASVGVSYQSDLHLVRQTLQRVGEGMSWRAPEKPPVVLLLGFGDSAVNFELSVWTKNPWERQQCLDEMHEAIWWSFQAQNVVIAFPQLDLHVIGEKSATRS